MVGLGLKKCFFFFPKSKVIYFRTFMVGAGPLWGKDSFTEGLGRSTDTLSQNHGHLLICPLLDDG